MNSLLVWFDPEWTRGIFSASTCAVRHDLERFDPDGWCVGCFAIVKAPLLSGEGHCLLRHSDGE